MINKKIYFDITIKINDELPIENIVAVTLDDAAIRRLAAIDLNLLVVFSALMQDGSVTLAADRLFVGQPAVSASRKRLRQVFGNPLFVKEVRGLVATERALQLQPLVDGVLAHIDRLAFQPPLFDPAVARLTIRVGFSDDLKSFSRRSSSAPCPERLRRCA